MIDEGFTLIQGNFIHRSRTDLTGLSGTFLPGRTQKQILVRRSFNETSISNKPNSINPLRTDLELARFNNNKSHQLNATLKWTFGISQLDSDSVILPLLFCENTSRCRSFCDSVLLRSGIDTCRSVNQYLAFRRVVCACLCIERFGVIAIADASVKDTGAIWRECK